MCFPLLPLIVCSARVHMRINNLEMSESGKYDYLEWKLV